MLSLLSPALCDVVESCRFHLALVHTERSQDQDGFGLGVLVFLMLMGGVHPFSGVNPGQGEVPPLFSRIAAGDFLIRAIGGP